MARLAFCGLGAMGLPMALRFVEAGHQVTAWNRSSGKAGSLLERGAQEAGTPARAAAGAEAVITMVATPEALEAVVFGEEGLASGMEPGSTLIEMSTVGPEAVKRLAHRLPPGVQVIDAPVLGSVTEARDGILKVFVGGSEDACDRWLPVLQAVGMPRRVGPPGAGAAMKVVVNSALLSLMATLGEALALADALGLEEEVVLDALSDSPIGVTARSKRDNIASDRYPARFRLELARKDARLVADAARAGGLRLPVAAAARGWLDGAADAGLGAFDYSAVVAFARGRRPEGEPRSGPEERAEAGE